MLGKLFFTVTFVFWGAYSIAAGVAIKPFHRDPVVLSCRTNKGFYLPGQNVQLLLSLRGKPLASLKKLTAVVIKLDKPTEKWRGQLPLKKAVADDHDRAGIKVSLWHVG